MRNLAYLPLLTAVLGVLALVAVVVGETDAGQVLALVAVATAVLSYRE